jgi:hypothetical protein
MEEKTMKRIKVNKRGAAPIALILIIVFGLFAAGTGVVLVDNYLDSRSAETQQQEELAVQSSSCQWENQLVKENVYFWDKYTSGTITPTTLTVFDAKPKDWDVATGDFGTDQAGYLKAESASAGVMLLQEHPGTYWVVAQESNNHTAFFTVEIPCDSGSESLSDYNAEPGAQNVYMAAVDTVSNIAAIDLGTLTNTTSQQDYKDYNYWTIPDDTELCLDKVTIREDATYSFATDADADGEYDEGIEYLKVKIECGSHFSKSAVLFDVSKSIDEFSGDNEAVMDFDAVICPEEQQLMTYVEVECDKGTRDNTGDADEYLGQGEDPFDFVFTDCEGNTATSQLTG